MGKCPSLTITRFASYLLIENNKSKWNFYLCTNFQILHVFHNTLAITSINIYFSSKQFLLLIFSPCKFCIKITVLYSERMSWFWTTILNSYLRLIPTPWSYFLLHVHRVFRDGFVVSESDLNLVWKKKKILCILLELCHHRLLHDFFFMLNILKLCRRELIFNQTVL